MKTVLTVIFVVFGLIIVTPSVLIQLNEFGTQIVNSDNVLSDESKILIITSFLLDRVWVNQKMGGERSVDLLRDTPSKFCGELDKFEEGNNSSLRWVFWCKPVDIDLVNENMIIVKIYKGINIENFFDNAIKILENKKLGDFSIYTNKLHLQCEQALPYFEDFWEKNIDCSRIKFELVTYPYLERLLVKEERTGLLEMAKKSLERRSVMIVSEEYSIYKIPIISGMKNE